MENKTDLLEMLKDVMIKHTKDCMECQTADALICAESAELVNNVRDSKEMLYTCTVCFFPGLKRPPADYLICPCCGVEFGYSDAGPKGEAFYHKLLREQWIDDGCNWSSRVVKRPVDWDPFIQLRDREI